MTVDQFKGVVGDLARPFAMISVSVAVAEAIMVGRDSAIIGAAGIILIALYGAKSAENAAVSKHDASIQIAQAQNATP